MKSYISSRKPLSPVQRQISATALGNLVVSSVLPGSAFWPNHIEPSETNSCPTLPERPLTMSDASRSARMWSSIGPNWPIATIGNAVYSPSVPNSHG